MDPTICTRNGGTPVEVFLQQLQQNKFAGAWHFSAKAGERRRRATR